jgi:hypothetical protein
VTVPARPGLSSPAQAEFKVAAAAAAAAVAALVIWTPKDAMIVTVKNI